MLAKKSTSTQAGWLRTTGKALWLRLAALCTELHGLLSSPGDTAPRKPLYEVHSVVAVSGSTPDQIRIFIFVCSANMITGIADIMAFFEPSDRRLWTRIEYLDDIDHEPFRLTGSSASDPKNIKTGDKFSIDNSIRTSARNKEVTAPPSGLGGSSKQAGSAPRWGSVPDHANDGAKDRQPGSDAGVDDDNLNLGSNRPPDELAGDTRSKKNFVKEIPTSQRSLATGSQLDRIDFHVRQPLELSVAGKGLLVSCLDIQGPVMRDISRNYRDHVLVPVMASTPQPPRANPETGP